MIVTNAQIVKYRNGQTVAQLSLRYKQLSPKIEAHIARFLMRHETQLAMRR